MPATFPVGHLQEKVTGVTRLEWSTTGKYIASQSVSHDRTIFIWDIGTLTLIHVFTFLTPVTDAKWSPTDDNLVVAVGTDKLLNWKPNGFRVSHVQEAAIQIQFVQWASDGESLAAFDSIAGTCTLSFVLGDDE
jgi:WD40 repeat protein